VIFHSYVKLPEGIYHVTCAEKKNEKNIPSYFEMLTLGIYLSCGRETFFVAPSLLMFREDGYP